MKNSKTIIIAIIALILLGLLYVFMTVNKVPKVIVESETLKPVIEEVVNKEVENTIVYNSAIKKPSPVFKFKEGEKVKLNIISDISDEAHLHGYDISSKLSSNSTSTLEFLATKSGRFPMELEKNGKEIAIIEVYPN
jgi:hypothetical protein